jgi:hypothetical protein
MTGAAGLFLSYLRQPCVVPAPHAAAFDSEGRIQKCTGHSIIAIGMITSAAHHGYSFW